MMSKTQTETMKFLSAFLNNMDIQLEPCQKLFLKRYMLSNLESCAIFPRRNPNKMIIALIKSLKMDFVLATPSGIETYKNGKLVHAQSYKNKKNNKNNIFVDEFEERKDKNEN